MAFNVLTRKVSDQLNKVSEDTAACAYNNNQSNVQETMGRSKNTEEKNKRKNNDTDNCKAF